MSFILSFTINGGIVMAADNARSTYTNNTWIVENNFRKLYVTAHNIGISIGGDVFTEIGIPILTLLNQFIDNYGISLYTPIQTAQTLLNFIRSFDTKKKFIFHISGYEIKDNIPIPQIFRIVTQENKIKLVNEKLSTPTLKWDAGNESPKLFLEKAYDYNVWVSMKRAKEFVKFIFKACSDISLQREGARTIGENPDLLSIQLFNHVWINKNDLGDNICLNTMATLN